MCLNYREGDYHGRKQKSICLVIYNLFAGFFKRHPTYVLSFIKQDKDIFYENYKSFNTKKARL